MHKIFLVTIETSEEVGTSYAFTTPTAQDKFIASVGKLLTGFSVRYSEVLVDVDPPDIEGKSPFRLGFDAQGRPLSISQLNPIYGLSLTYPKIDSLAGDLYVTGWFASEDEAKIQAARMIAEHLQQ